MSVFRRTRHVQSRMLTFPHEAERIERESVRCTHDSINMYCKAAGMDCRHRCLPAWMDSELPVSRRLAHVIVHTHTQSCRGNRQRRRNSRNAIAQIFAPFEAAS